MKFLKALWSQVIKPFPVASVMLVIAIVLLLGGAVWWVLGLIIKAVSKASPDAGKKIEDGLNKVAEKTGS